MNIRLIDFSVLSFVLLGGMSCAPVASQEADAAAPPRLVILCCVDQLATWVFDEGLPHFAENGGFRRMMRDGVRFTRCEYDHGCTETGPGHATIGTGLPAAVHGIVRNSWWSVQEGRVLYCVGHPAPALPSMPEGGNRGGSRLLVETLSQRMRADIAGCKTASVAWKDRSAILMVGSHADVAAWFDGRTGKLVTNKTWCQEVPAWITKFNVDRQIDSFHGQVWARIGPDSAYEGLVDDRSYEIPHQNGSNARTLPQPMTGSRPEPDIGYYTQLYYSPFGNEIVRLAAQAAIEGMELGADAVPDLLAVGFSSTDSIGHYFGPDSVEARDALLRLDRQLGDFLTYLDDQVGAGRYTIFLTADHGIAPTPEWAKTRGVDAGRGLIQMQARAVAEQVIIARFGKAPAGSRYCSHVGEWSLVFDRAAFVRGDGDEAAARRHAEAIELAVAAVPRVRGLSAAYATRDVLDADPGDDAIRRALRAGLHPDRAGDVQLVVTPYWLDGVNAASHGSPHLYDRAVVGLAMGAGIAAGLEIEERVSPGLGVPLFASLLGIEPPAQVSEKIPALLRAAR